MALGRGPAAEPFGGGGVDEPHGSDEDGAVGVKPVLPAVEGEQGPEGVAPGDVDPAGEGELAQVQGVEGEPGGAEGFEGMDKGLVRGGADAEDFHDRYPHTNRWHSKKLPLQGLRNLRNETYTGVRRSDEG